MVCVSKVQCEWNEVSGSLLRGCYNVNGGQAVVSENVLVDPAKQRKVRLGREWYNYGLIYR